MKPQEEPAESSRMLESSMNVTSQRESSFVEESRSMADNLAQVSQDQEKDAINQNQTFGDGLQPRGDAPGFLRTDEPGKEEVKLSERVTNQMKKQFSEIGDLFWFAIPVVITMRDRGRMSMTIIVLGILFVIVAIIVWKAFLFEHEVVIGNVHITPIGQAYTQPDTSPDGYAWDSLDIVPSLREKSGIFIPTRVKKTVGQTPGTCPSPLVPCSTPDDCKLNIPNMKLSGQCEPLAGDQKGCAASQWCPASNVNDPSSTQVSDLLYIDSLKLMIKSCVIFGDTEVYSSSNDQKIMLHPYPKANTYELRSLLELAGTSFQNVNLVGAVLLMRMSFECYRNFKACTVKVTVTKLDGVAQGFSTTKIKFDPDGKREEIRTNGIRIYIEAQGYGIQITLYSILYTITVLVGFFLVGNTITERLTLGYLGEQRHFLKAKYVNA